MDEELSKSTSINLPLGHLLVVWDVLSNKLSSTPYKSEFTEEQMRALWSLEDLCEKKLIAIGVADTHGDSWEQLMEKANTYCKTIPADYLD